MGRVVAALSFLLWAAYAVAGAPGEDATTHLIGTVLAVAPLLLVPLGAGLLNAGSGSQPGRLQWAIAAWLVVAALSLPAGTAAGVLALPWLGVSLWLVRQLVWGRLADWKEPSKLAGLAAPLYLVVGGGWLVISRVGLQPLGFDPVIVLLTAVHFHYAGFCTLVIVSRLGRVVPEPAIRPFRAAAVGAVVGTPVLAAGITLSPLLELAGAFILVASLLLLAGLLLFVIVPELDCWPAQTLLGAAAGFLAIGMVLAAGYAVARFETLPILPIPQMVALHGIANGFGFSTLGLLGLRLLKTRSPDR